jgi:membrane associated rhomboid family serine protease
MLSYEGVWILSRVALGAVLILVAAAIKTMVGRSKERGRVMLAGTVGGITLGVVSAPLFSNALGVDVSAIAALIGIVIGWAVAWTFARRIPRTAT